jgi:hypothetical protein
MTRFLQTDEPPGARPNFRFPQLSLINQSASPAGVSGIVDAAMKCFSSSPELVAYDVFTPREFDAPEAIRGYSENHFASAFKYAKIEFVYLHVTSDGTIGYRTVSGTSGRSLKTVRGWTRSRGRAMSAPAKWKLEDYPHPCRLPGRSGNLQGRITV